MADAFFAEKFSGEAEVDGAGGVEALQVLCRQDQVDCFEVFIQLVEAGGAYDGDAFEALLAGSLKGDVAGFYA